MTRDPDWVACTDTLLGVARRMRNLLVAFLPFLPVIDEHGDLWGIVALRDVQRVIAGRAIPPMPRRPPPRKRLWRRSVWTTRSTRPGA